MNSYIELFEQIVGEMKGRVTSGDPDVSEHDLSVWCDFLAQIKPESELAGKRTGIPLPREPSALRVSDVREIMQLADANGYPTWHIRINPKARTALQYVLGRLRDSEMKYANVPHEISGFTGFLRGAIRTKADSGYELVAYDTSSGEPLLKKFDFLKRNGFSVLDYVSFPTEKIQSTSSAKLEELFRNFAASGREQGFEGASIAIVADTPILFPDGREAGREIEYVPAV